MKRYWFAFSTHREREEREGVESQLAEIKWHRGGEEDKKRVRTESFAENNARKNMFCRIQTERKGRGPLGLYFKEHY